MDSWEVVRARGHLDEVQELKSGETAQALAQGRPSKESMQLVLTEGAVLGGGAFSRVSIVTGFPSPPLNSPLKTARPLNSPFNPL